MVAVVLALGWVWRQSRGDLGKQARLPLGVGRAGRTPLRVVDLEEGTGLLGDLPDHLKGVGRAGRTPLRVVDLEEGTGLLGDLPDHLKGVGT